VSKQPAARRWWRLALATPIIFSLAVPAIIVAQTPDASFVERTNQVEYSPAGSARWQPASPDVALAPGDRLRTGAASAARVGFFDGTTTALGASTGLRVDRLDADPARIKVVLTSGLSQARVASGAGMASYEIETSAVRVAAPAAACPWVRVAADGTTLVRNYGAGPTPAVDPQPVQDVVYAPVPMAGPAGPVPVPMPQVVTAMKQMPPSAAPDEQPLLTCAPSTTASAAGTTETGSTSAAGAPSVRLGDVAVGAPHPSDVAAAPLLGGALAAPAEAAVAQQDGPSVTVSGGDGSSVQVPLGYESEIRPGGAPGTPAPIGTAAAQAAARAASLQAVQQAGLALQQANAAAAQGQMALQGQAAAAMAGMTAAIGHAVETAGLANLVQRAAQATAVPVPTAAPAAPPGTVAQAACATVVGGMCNIAGAGFFGQCTKIGSMSCQVTVSIAGAGLTGKTAASPSVTLATTKGNERLTCTPPVPGAATFTCVGPVTGDVGQNSTVVVTFAPGVTISGTASQATANDLLEPPVRASVNGVLDTTLTARYGPVAIAGQTVQAETYESSYPGPTLRFRPQERLRIHLNNQLPPVSFDPPPTARAGGASRGAHDASHDAAAQGLDFTNLHIHGMHVSPVGNGDNIFLSINPGDSFQYDYPIPPDAPPGLYWYHPHRHGLTEQQDSMGMMGAMIVEGGLDNLPGIAGLRERLLVLHAVQIVNGAMVPGDQIPDLSQVNYTVNGQLNPIIRIQPGETQRWRIGNTSADTFLRIAIDRQTMYQIASDGNTWDKPVAQSEIVLAPAARAEILVQCTRPGSTTFRTLPFSQPFLNTVNQPLATVICDGPAWTPQPMPTALMPAVDLRNVPITGNGGQTRIVTFSEQFTIGPNCPPSQGNPPFCPQIDGKLFDPNRVDIQVKLGTTEEWLIQNTSTESHPFHIHVNPFQVTAVNGVPVPFHGYVDTFEIPFGGSFTMRTQFTDFVGKFVIHCHILGHEDAGMMAVVEVVP
jgi:FtsP/CotA-like multicopper oxidase with cupredoxin domain